MYTWTGPWWSPPMASLEQERSPGCWCISTVMVEPAATLHLPCGEDGLALQAKLLDVTSETGLLDEGRRAHVEPCWGVLVSLPF